jgi:hypothetical protein
MDKETSEEALERAIKAHRRVFVPGRSWPVQANRTIAENVLNQELGHFADRHSPYHLDQETRDLLLAHTRQDAAQALLNTISMMEEIHRLKKTLSILGFALFVSLVWIEVWKYWPFIKEWLEGMIVPSK